MLISGGSLHGHRPAAVLCQSGRCTTRFWRAFATRRAASETHGAAALAEKSLLNSARLESEHVLGTSQSGQPAPSLLPRPAAASSSPQPRRPRAWHVAVAQREPARTLPSQPAPMRPAEHTPRPLRQATEAFLTDRGSFMCRLYPSDSQE